MRQSLIGPVAAKVTELCSAVRSHLCRRSDRQRSKSRHGSSGRRLMRSSCVRA